MTAGEGASALHALLARAEADWSDNAVHRALLDAAQKPEHLALVARFYRLHTTSDERRALAEAQLKHVTSLALVHLETARLKRRPEPAHNRGKYLVIVAFLAGSAVLLAYL